MLKIGDKVLQKKRERSYRASQEGRAHDLRRAEDLLRRGLVTTGLDQKDLAEIPGADPRKMALASLIWSETTASQKWLAEKLFMSSAPNVSQILRRWKNCHSNCGRSLRKIRLQKMSMVSREVFAKMTLSVQDFIHKKKSESSDFPEQGMT